MQEPNVNQNEGAKLVRGALEYFVAGVPPFSYFKLEVSHLTVLVKSSRKDKFSRLNATAEVALIGLAAYFEAFCKAQFAGLVNICPRILENFVERRKNSTVSLRHILVMLTKVRGKLGNVISEEQDFGSAKEINGLYQDLLRITPFSANETKDYARFLNDRNLLVHHGGVYTLRYSAQRFVRQSVSGLAHWDSLVVGKKEFARWRAFIIAIAKKIAKTSCDALNKFIGRARIRLTAKQKQAVEMLTRGV